MTAIIQRQEAKHLGLTRYFTGKPSVVMIEAKVRSPKCNHPFTVRHAGEMTAAQQDAADQVLKEAQAVLDRASKGMDGISDRLTRAFDAFIGRK